MNKILHHSYDLMNSLRTGFKCQISTVKLNLKYTKNIFLAQSHSFLLGYSRSQADDMVTRYCQLVTLFCLRNSTLSHPFYAFSILQRFCIFLVIFTVVSVQWGSYSSKILLYLHINLYYIPKSFSEKNAFFFSGRSTSKLFQIPKCTWKSKPVYSCIYFK